MQEELVKIMTENIMRNKPHIDKIGETMFQLEITREFLENTRQDINDENAKQIYMVIRRDLDKTINNLKELLKEMPTDYQNNSVDLVSGIVKVVVGNIAVNK